MPSTGDKHVHGPGYGHIRGLTRGSPRARSPGPGGQNAYGRQIRVTISAMSVHGPLRQILQRKRMSAFRVIAEVAARRFDPLGILGFEILPRQLQIVVGSGD